MARSSCLKAFLSRRDRVDALADLVKASALLKDGEEKIILRVFIEI
jgi:hypothetical protein